MAKIGGGKPSDSPADQLRAGLPLPERHALRAKQADDVEQALHAWVHMQSTNNSIRLYAAACAYFGIKQVIPD